jgi:hypothetical protein
MPKKYRRAEPIIPHIHKALGEFLKLELKKGSMNYSEFAREFKRFGKPETEASIRCKLSRGTYSALFLMLALDILKRDAIGRREIMSPANKAASESGRRVPKLRYSGSGDAATENYSNSRDWLPGSATPLLLSGSRSGWVSRKRGAP